MTAKHVHFRQIPIDEKTHFFQVRANCQKRVTDPRCRYACFLCRAKRYPIRHKNKRAIANRRHYPSSSVRILLVISFRDRPF